MSLFDIDWNNDGKIDFKDTLYDMALVDEDERNTSRSDYSDDDIYDTDDLEILLSDNINISSSNTLVNNPVGLIMFLMNYCHVGICFIMITKYILMIILKL